MSDPGYQTETDAPNRKANGHHFPGDETNLILSSGQFVAGFIPPDYLLDGILLCGYVYSFTANTGHGKTAVALLLTALVALGQALAGRDVVKGRVLYFAGENPTDVRMRWIGMAEKFGFDADAIDVCFIDGVYDIKMIEKRIHDEIEERGGVILIVIDTSPAYFTGDDENDNPQMIAHAQMLYGLKKLPGNPTVLAACHPVKNAGKDNLIPRGGGGFINAIDGNVTAWRDDTIVTFHHQGKFRGIDFEPIMFELVGVNPAKLKDSRGRQIPTVCAVALSKDDESAKRARSFSEGDDILLLLFDQQGELISGSDIAKGLQWWTKDHSPAKTKVQRAIEKLNAGSALVDVERSGMSLTKKGLKAATALDETRPGGSQRPEKRGPPTTVF
jgi:AAA domain